MLQQNIRRKNTVSARAAEDWLKQNPHRTAEQMTGKLAPDSVICKLRKSNDHACTTRNPDTLIERTTKRKKDK